MKTGRYQSTCETRSRNVARARVLLRVSEARYKHRRLYLRPLHEALKAQPPEKDEPPASAEL